MPELELLAITDEGGEPMPPASDEGRTLLRGRTEEGRDRTILHDHEYALEAYVDEEGILIFEGKTGPASVGPPHDHDIYSEMSDSMQTEYAIDTEEAGETPHVHLVQLKLPHVLGPVDQEEGEAASEQTAASADPEPNVVLFTEANPVEETEGQVHYRIKNPGLFRKDTFRTFAVKGVTGVQIVAGKLKPENVGRGKADSMIAQKYLFSKKNWTLARARAWVARNRDRTKASVLQDPPSTPKPPSTTKLIGCNFPWIRKLAAAPQNGQGGVMYGDGAGYVSLRKGQDDRRILKQFDTDVQYSAPLDDIQRIIELGRPQVTITPEGFLKHQVARTGDFVHPIYKKLNITEEKLRHMVMNFDQGVLRQMAGFNLIHDTKLGGAGWLAKVMVEPYQFTRVNSKGDLDTVDGWGIWSLTKLTPFGVKEIIELGKWAYTSAEIAWLFREPEFFATEQGLEGANSTAAGKFMEKLFGKVVHRNVLAGAAATNTPFISSMEAFAASKPVGNAEEVNRVYREVMELYSENVFDAHHEVEEAMRKRKLISY